MPASTIATGAKVVCYINGFVYGLVTGMSFGSATPHKELRGIDSQFPIELAPTMVSISGQLELLRRAGDGGLEAAGITAQFQQITQQRYFSIMLLDRLTNSVLFQANYCVCTGQQWGIPSRGIVTGSFPFTALEWNNEVKPVNF